MGLRELCPVLLLIAFISPGVCLALHHLPANACDCSGGDYPNRDDREEDEVSALPPNVSVPVVLKPTLDLMLRRCPTFRRQCKVLRDAKNVRINLRVTAHQTTKCPSRAMSGVRRFDEGLVLITIWLTAPGPYIEVIGHEFEHAVEQAEGLGLRALAEVRGRKVWQVDEGEFETERAIQAGYMVADEYYFWKHPSSAETASGNGSEALHTSAGSRSVGRYPGQEGVFAGAQEKRK